MHQTFYIDVDEEISSVIDRLNKSMSIDNYFVVPKRALFLQSIVNLKILKREADKMSKRVVIVSQDEVVISMAERCQIDTRENLDGLDAVSDAYLDQNDEIEEDEYEEEEEMEEAFEKNMHSNHDKQIRLKNIGSGEYYQSGNNYEGAPLNVVKEKKSPVIHRAIKSKLSKARPEKIVLQKVSKGRGKMSSVVGAKYADHFGKATFKGDLDPRKAQTLEKMFSSHADHHKKEEVRHIGNGKVKKVFAAFMLLCVLVFVGVGGYLFAPSAKIVIKTELGKKKIDMELKANTVQAADGKSIPLKVIKEDQQLTFPYDVTATGAVSGKKAHGKVIISNEYSSESQTLVATTRLEAEGGKIFRLVKNVVVPGYSSVGGQNKAGVIQADIVADQAGEEYNIENTKFTIPGFAGGPKFDKFYATSDGEATGGSSDGQSENASGRITQTDLDSAKLKAENAFKQKMNELVKGELSDGEIVLDQAQKITITKSSSSAKVGAIADSFEWVVSGSVQALVFSQEDVKKKISETFEKNNQVKNEISKIDYGSADPDFDEPSLNIRIYSEVISTPLIDTGKIKEELLGKNDSQLSDILRKYSTIKSANVEFSPSFMTRIPTYSSRVSVEVVNEPK